MWFILSFFIGFDQEVVFQDKIFHSRLKISNILEDEI